MLHSWSSPNLRPESDHRCLMLLLFCEHITSPRIVFTSSPTLLCLFTRNYNWFNHIEYSILSLNHNEAVFARLHSGCTHWDMHAWYANSTSQSSAESVTINEDESSTGQNMDWTEYRCIAMRSCSYFIRIKARQQCLLHVIPRNCSEMFDHRIAPTPNIAHSSCG